MKTIATEIRSFLDSTRLTQSRLSVESGVPASTICNLLKGKRQNLLGPNQDAIRAAMARLAASPPPSPSPIAASDELHELSDGMVSIPSYIAEVVVQGILEKR